MNVRPIALAAVGTASVAGLLMVAGPASAATPAPSAAAAKCDAGAWAARTQGVQGLFGR